MDEFEAFRKKKLADKKQDEENERNAKVQEQVLGWVDGLGPDGPKNPKVEGFVLGRYKKHKVNPKELKKPENFESGKFGNKPPGTVRPPTPEKELEERERIKGIQKY